MNSNAYSGGFKPNVRSKTTTNISFPIDAFLLMQNRLAIRKIVLESNPNAIIDSRLQVIAIK